MAVLRRVLATVWMALACWSASAAELTTTQSKKNQTIVVLDGELAAGDASRFKNILKASAAAGKPVSAVRLNVPDGSLMEGTRLAAVIQGANLQGAKIATVIVAGATCGGACFLPFIAGSQKFVSAAATVKVPGAKSDRQPTGDTPALLQADKPDIVRVVQKLGLLDAIITRMLATPDDKVFLLTLDDLRAMGATITGKPTQPR